ncbi:MAG TPA: LacI family DNA-binding transcriptional regulator [Chloroflexota bacterium]
MAVTRDDVARLAGVSAATVSYVLNGGPRPVMDETREKVLQAIEQLDYKPNLLARRMARKKTHAVALVVPDIANPFFAKLSHHVEDAAFAAGYTLILCNCSHDVERERAHLALLDEKRIDGILLITSGLGRDDVRGIVERHTPVVLLDRDVAGATVDAVLTDNVAIGRSAVEHLLGHGYTAIACLAGPQGLAEAVQRVEGYQQALRQYDLTPEPRLVRWHDLTFEGGYRALHSLFAAGLRPRAVFASNDQMAVGALHAAHELGLTVPADLAIVGVDDTLPSAIAVPPLTTVAQPIAAMGRRGLALLLDRVKGTASPAAQHVVLAPELIVRGSCGCAPTSPTIHWNNFAFNGSTLSHAVAGSQPVESMAPRLLASRGE